MRLKQKQRGYPDSSDCYLDCYICIWLYIVVILALCFPLIGSLNNVYLSNYFGKLLEKNVRKSIFLLFYQVALWRKKYQHAYTFITFSSKCKTSQVSSKSIDQRVGCDIPSTCWAQSCVSCCRYDCFCCCGTRYSDSIRQCQRSPDSSYIQLLATLNYDYRYKWEIGMSCADVKYLSTYFILGYILSYHWKICKISNRPIKWNINWANLPLAKFDIRWKFFSCRLLCRKWSFIDFYFIFSYLNCYKYYLAIILSPASKSFSWLYRRIHMIYDI